MIENKAMWTGSRVCAFWGSHRPRMKSEFCHMLMYSRMFPDPKTFILKSGEVGPKPGLLLTTSTVKDTDLQGRDVTSAISPGSSNAPKKSFPFT